jgi:hypothetical protein
MTMICLLLPLKGDEALANGVRRRRPNHITTAAEKPDRETAQEIEAPEIVLEIGNILEAIARGDHEIDMKNLEGPEESRLNHRPGPRRDHAQGRPVGRLLHGTAILDHLIIETEEIEAWIVTINIIAIATCGFDPRSHPGITELPASLNIHAQPREGPRKFSSPHPCLVK